MPTSWLAAPRSAHAAARGKVGLSARYAAALGPIPSTISRPTQSSIRDVCRRGPVN